MRQKFLVELSNFHAKEIYHKGRLSDDLSLKIYFDDHTYHTSDKHSGSDGEAIWSFKKSFVYKVPVGELNHLHLEGRVLRIVCWQAHRGEYGETVVDLYTLATGPQDHDLPLVTGPEKKVVGRLSFTVAMEHFTEMRATFQFLKVNHLFPLPGHARTHAYLRYGHSTSWRQNGYFEESCVYDDTENPEWWDLIPLSFLTSYARFVRESIDVAVCHHGTFTDGEYGHCNLIFVRPGKDVLTEGKECKFSGPLKYGNSTIEGKIIVSNLPKYAQMIPKSPLRKSVHTEQGIYNSVPLLIGLPLPKCPIIETAEKDAHHEEDHDAKMHQIPPLEEEVHKELHEDVVVQKTKVKLSQSKDFNSSHDSQGSHGSHGSHGSGHHPHHHHHHHKDEDDKTNKTEPLAKEIAEKPEPTNDNLIDFNSPNPEQKKAPIMNQYGKDPYSLYAPFWKTASNNYVHL